MSGKRQRSREYPALSLKRAVELARRVYDKDRMAEAPALSAARHIGYGGLNGGSRTTLSALKKFGLLEYSGSGNHLKVKLTDLARRILVPTDEQDRGRALEEALNSPRIYAELAERFGGWDLPSDDTLAASLRSEFGIQPAAVKRLIADIRESVEYVAQLRKSRVADNGPAPRREISAGMPETAGPPKTASADGPEPDSQGSDETGQIRLPMPGSRAYIVLPERMDEKEGKRVLSWLKRVVVPAVEFASGIGSDDETF